MVDDSDDTDDGGFRITLPPIRLPPLGFPEGLTPYLPAPLQPRVRGNLLLAAIALDIVDAIVILSVGGGLLRIAVGVVLVAILFGPIGLAYAWEALSLVALQIGLVPSATFLALARRNDRRVEPMH